MSNLVGNAPNQVPTNADLGDLAYQDADYVRIGELLTDSNLTVTGGAGIGANIYVGGNASVAGNAIVSGNVVATNANINGDVSVATGNIDLSVGNINVTAGNIFLNTGTLSTDANAVITRGYLDTQLIIFGI
jgi:cytoskeletal protein CcmA (bactofilin family)